MTAEPSSFEQLMVELINRARSDPQGELDHLILQDTPAVGAESGITAALRFFGVDIDLLRSQLDGVQAVAPLAWNEALGVSSHTHSQLMIDFDTQSHFLPGEPGLGARITQAGYQSFQSVAENIFAFTESPVHGHAGFYIDWGVGPGGIQNPAGHRLAILDPDYDEIGIGAIAENNPNTDVGPFVVTQHFGTRFGISPMLTGVVIDDFDNDDFYDIGEGLGNVEVTASGTQGTFSTVTYGSGGYSLALPNGTYTVTFTGEDLGGDVVRSVTISGENVKLDAEVDDVQAPLGAISGGVTADSIIGTNGNDTIFGFGGDDRIFGKDGADDLRGGANNDMLAGQAGDDSLRGESGNDRVFGGDGNDVVFGGSGNDYVRGDAGNDEVHGGIGDDEVIGSFGNDRVFGDAGNDLVSGEEGNDRVHGGAGDDKVFGGTGDDYGEGNDGNDVLGGSRGLDRLFGGNGNDVLAGQHDADFLAGGAGDDRMFGGGDNDILIGSGGNDLLVAGAGDDRLEGGRGNDVLSGGDGADAFIYNLGVDRINDFQNDVDEIVLVGFNFANATAALNVASQSGANVVFNFGGGNVLTVRNTTEADLLDDLLV